MYGDQLGEFVCGYQGVKGQYSLIFKESRGRGGGGGGLTEDLKYLYMGCLPFVQTTWVEILCMNIKTLKLDVEGEQLAKNYIIIIIIIINTLFIQQNIDQLV